MSGEKLGPSSGADSSKADNGDQSLDWKEEQRRKMEENNKKWEKYKNDDPTKKSPEDIAEGKRILESTLGDNDVKDPNDYRDGNPEHALEYKAPVNAKKIYRSIKNREIDVKDCSTAELNAAMNYIEIVKRRLRLLGLTALTTVSVILGINLNKANANPSEANQEPIVENAGEKTTQSLDDLAFQVLQTTEDAQDHEEEEREHSYEGYWLSEKEDEDYIIPGYNFVDFGELAEKNGNDFFATLRDNVENNGTGLEVASAYMGCFSEDSLKPEWAHGKTSIEIEEIVENDDAKAKELKEWCSAFFNGDPNKYLGGGYSTVSFGESSKDEQCYFMYYEGPNGEKLPADAVMQSGMDVTGRNIRLGVGKIGRSETIAIVTRYDENGKEIGHEKLRVAPVYNEKGEIVGYEYCSQPYEETHEIPKENIITVTTSTPDEKTPPDKKTPPDEKRQKDKENMENLQNQYDERMSENTGGGTVTNTEMNATEESFTPAPKTNNGGVAPEIQQNNASTGAESISQQVSNGNNYSNNRPVEQPVYTPVTPPAPAPAPAPDPTPAPATDPTPPPATLDEAVEDFDFK